MFMSPNYISVDTVSVLIDEKLYCFLSMTFLIVLHDEIDYSYTYYIHEEHRFFFSFGIDLVSFHGKSEINQYDDFYLWALRGSIKSNLQYYISFLTRRFRIPFFFFFILNEMET